MCLSGGHLVLHGMIFFSKPLNTLPCFSFRRMREHTEWPERVPIDGDGLFWVEDAARMEVPWGGPARFETETPHTLFFLILSDSSLPLLSPSLSFPLHPSLVGGKKM